MSDKYDEIKLIGEGAFGKVYLVKDKKNGRMLVKKMTEENPKFEKYIKGELTLNEKLRSIKPEYVNYSIEEFMETKHVEVQATGKKVEKKYAVLILPYCDSKDLDKYVEANKYLSEDETKRFAYQILIAIKSCHEADIMHRDLKLQNVLLNKEGNELKAYLCDFGLAKQSNVTNTILGTYAFMAPELFQAVVKKTHGVAYDKKVDIWSFGMMVFKMLTGTLPFDSMDDFEAFLKTKAISIPKTRSLSICALSFLESCLQYDPKVRGDILNLLQHEFIVSKSIPWYYFRWIADDPVNVAIDSLNLTFTNKIKNKKEEMERKMKADPMFFSLHAQYSLPN